MENALENKRQDVERHGRQDAAGHGGKRNRALPLRQKRRDRLPDENKRLFELGGGHEQAQRAAFDLAEDPLSPSPHERTLSTSGKRATLHQCQPPSPSYAERHS
eukprot:1747704-Lingulodinium_polyedra.AAC.1